MKRWTEISDNPNAFEVAHARFQAIQAARSPELILDRIGFLSKAVMGKNILDVGVVAHTTEATQAEDWLHAHLSRSALSCTGVDILPESVAFLQNEGYNVVLADITQQPLDQTFEVIVAGEVMEHLGNPGPFMTNCARMLSPRGRMLVTVPNPWYLNVMLKNLSQRRLYIDSADHVVWYDPNSFLELAQRSGLNLGRWAGIAADAPKTGMGKMAFALKPLLARWGVATEIFAKSMYYEFVKP